MIGVPVSLFSLLLQHLGYPDEREDSTESSRTFVSSRMGTIKPLVPTHGSLSTNLSTLLHTKRRQTFTLDRDASTATLTTPPRRDILNHDSHPETNVHDHIGSPHGDLSPTLVPCQRDARDFNGLLRP